MDLRKWKNENTLSIHLHISFMSHKRNKWTLYLPYEIERRSISLICTNSVMILCLSLPKTARFTKEKARTVSGRTYQCHMPKLTTSYFLNLSPSVYVEVEYNWTNIIFFLKEFTRILKQHRIHYKPYQPMMVHFIL